MIHAGNEKYKVKKNVRIRVDVVDPPCDPLEIHTGIHFGIHQDPSRDPPWIHLGIL